MLGGYIGDVLLERGWAVRALARSAEARASLERRGFEPVEGRIEDGRSLAEAAGGCALLLHAAAAIGPQHDWDHFRRANVAGTQHVVEAARGAGARLVHVSSTAVYGRARYGPKPTDEDTALPELPAHDAYGRSKREAEDVVLAACRSGGVWATIVRPPVMYGIGDRQFIPRLAPVLSRGVFPLIAGGRSTLSLVHARNVAEGAVLAASRDEACGRVFLLTDDFPVTVATLVEGAARGLRRRVATPHVPTLIGRTSFALLAHALRVVGRGDLARHARGTFEMLTRDNPFSSRRAREVLGWTPSVVPSDAIPEAFAWWECATGARQGGA
jgi:nucleoside-diphosphate-sugar epimerase